MKIKFSEMIPDEAIDQTKPKRWWLGLDGAPTISNSSCPEYFDNAVIASVKETVTVRIGNLSLSFSSDEDTPIQLLDLEEHDNEIAKQIKAANNVKIGDEIGYKSGVGLKRGVVIDFGVSAGAWIGIICKGNEEQPYNIVSKDAIVRNFGKTELSRSLTKYISGGYEDEAD